MRMMSGTVSGLTPFNPNGKSRMKTLIRVVGLTVLLPAGCIAVASAGPSDGLQGFSRVFHVGCGMRLPGGNPAWQAAFDDSVAEPGYSYTVNGNAYNDPSQLRFNCWFFTTRGSVKITCPARVEGTLYIYCLDMNNAGREQTLTVCGRHTDSVANFGTPDGRWYEYDLTASDTAKGIITIDVLRNAGTNAVLSRIDFVPKGREDALVPEKVLKQQTANEQIRRDWHRQEAIKGRTLDSHEAVADLLLRGDALLADLRELGKQSPKLQQCMAESRKKLSVLCGKETDGDETAHQAALSAQWTQLYYDTRTAIREAALSNPLIDFDELLFVKRITPPPGHQCSHHVGSAQRPGSDLCILSGLRPDGEVRSILGEKLPVGAIGRPDLSFDAKRIVFPYALPRPEPTRYPLGQPGQVGGACLDYQLYEIGVDGKTLTRLTDGPGDNTEPCYLPDGRICFTSPRAGRLVQCGDWALVFSLFTMNRDGSDVQAITEAKEGEWFPSVLDDGRIIYMRWEYVMKPFNTIQYLWTVKPDGSGARLAFGDHFEYSAGPLSFIEARQIPGTSKVIATGAAHHNCGVGPICIVDLGKNRSGPDGLFRVTPEVGYPETSEMRGTSCDAGWYNAPYPLSEKHFLVCYSFEKAHNAAAGYGIYWMDVHGNKELIFRDARRSCYSPIPLRVRKRPPVLASPIEGVQDRATATVLMQDVYRGLPNVKRGTVKYLRILESVPKIRHSVPQRLDLGIGAGWDPRKILGTLPVETDGSACFEIPADTPVFFQALDSKHMKVRGMRSFMNLRPGETMACIGCHESYTAAPPNRKMAALDKKPVAIAPPPWGAEPVDFRRMVQGVLDRHCVTCHDGGEGDKKSFSLRGDHLVAVKGADNHWPPSPKLPHEFSAGYTNLLPHVNFGRLDGYRGGNTPFASYAIGSHRSRLIEVLDKGHYQVKLTPADRRAIVAWIDCNAPYLGGWDEHLVKGE